MKVRKDIKFDCCHRLSNYAGKCSNLHGHTYHGYIEVETTLVDEEDKMVVDYNELKAVVEPFDHAILFSSEVHRDKAEETLLRWAIDYNMRRVELECPYKTTAEDLCEVIMKAVKQKVPYSTVRVVLSETDGSYAEGVM